MVVMMCFSRLEGLLTFKSPFEITLELHNTSVTRTFLVLVGLCFYNVAGLFEFQGGGGGGT